MNTSMNRRTFLRMSTTAGAGLLVLSGATPAFTYEANGKLNVAGVGVGGQGRGDLDNIAGSGAALVALCDVDQAHAGDTFKKYPQAKPFQDFRRMLDEMGKGVDAVVVATPD